MADTMVYTKRPSGGILVERNSTTGAWLGPWVTIPGFTGTITLPGGNASKIDITTHDDVAAGGRFRQNGAGLADVTDPGGTMLLDPDNLIHKWLLDDFASGSVRYYRFSFPNVTRKFGVIGQVSISGQGDINGYLQATVTITANSINFNVT